MAVNHRRAEAVYVYRMTRPVPPPEGEAAS